MKEGPNLVFYSSLSVSPLLIVRGLDVTKISFKWPYIFVCMCVSEKLCWLERDVWHASAAARI